MIELDLTPQGRTHLRQNSEHYGENVIPQLLDALEAAEARAAELQKDLDAHITSGIAANKALDDIAKTVQPDDDGTWTDRDGLLESIGTTIEHTGRTVYWEGQPDGDDDA
jgi:hypothetical protein